MFVGQSRSLPRVPILVRFASWFVAAGLYVALSMVYQKKYRTALS